MNSKFVNLFLVIAMPFVILSSCSGPWSGDWDRPIPLTEILAIEYNPEHIVVGDSVRFKCVIRDSLDESYHFDWRFTTDSFLLRKVSDDPYITVLFDSAGVYQVRIVADNSQFNNLGVVKNLTITVNAIDQ